MPARPSETAGRSRSRASGAQVQLEVGCDGAELAEGSRLQLPDPLAGDPEARADLLERLRAPVLETEAEGEHALHARIQVQQGFGQLGRAKAFRGRLVRLVGVDVLDQVGVEAFAVADRGLETDRVLHELE